MRAFLIIFSIVGLCFGSDSVHHLRYKYSSYFKVGIPDDGDQVAGLAFKAVVDVFHEDEEGIAVFKLSDVSTLSFNEDLGGGDDLDFTDEHFRPFEDEDLKRIVEEPFRVNLRDSEPFAIEYEETDHRWLSNVRKGIASMLKNEILKGNFVTQEKDSVSSLFHQGHLVNNFIVEEETLFGICKAKYKIYQIPETILTGTNDLTPTREEGAKNDLWHMTRSIDFDNCKEIVALHVHTTNNIRHKHQKLGFTRTSDSSYVLRGYPGHFDVYSVVTEGGTTYPLSLFKENEEAQSTVKQKLVLIEESTSDVIPELRTSLKRSTTWMHEIWSPFQTPKELKSHPWIVYNNKNEPDLGYELFGTKKYEVNQIAAAKANILKLIIDASKKLTDMKQETVETPSDTITETLELATFYFRVLKKDDILKIFDHFGERNVGIERQLVINAAAAAGFNEAFEAIMDYIEKDQLEPFQIFTTLTTLSRNSFGSLNVSRLMDFLLRQEKPSGYLLNFAHYLSEYCIHKTNTFSPVAGDAECGSSLVTKRFIPYLKDIIYNEDLTWERTYAVKVLNLLRSGFTFEIVSPLIDGRVESSVALKAAAIRALEKWNLYPGNILRSSIIDLLTDVYSDVSQNLHVRIAALQAVTTWHPSTKFWYNLALMTWKDPSIEFASFAASLIEIYAEKNVPTFEKQSKGAAFAMKFYKPPTATSYSYNLGLSKEFFNRQAMMVMEYLYSPKSNNFDSSDVLFSILTNIGDLNLISLEENLLHGNRRIILNETVNKDRSNIPDATEFLEKLYNEIHYEEHPYKHRSKSELFIKIFNDIFIKFSSIVKLLPHFQRSDQSDPSMSHWGAHLYLMDKSDFHPNELGLPLFTFSAMPATVGFTQKVFPPKSGYLSGSQSLLRLSSVYSRGVTVFLPWNFHFSSAIVRSNLEITLPIEKNKRRNLGTEGPLTSSTTYYESFYKKKFPLIRISNTPLSVTYDLDPQNAEDAVVNYEVIRKAEVREKRISEINNATGIKYDLVLNADTTSSFGLGDFLRFTDIPFRVWSLSLYVEPEDSETEKLLITEASGKLLTYGQYGDSEESKKIDISWIKESSRSLRLISKTLKRIANPGQYGDLEERKKNEISVKDNFKERSRKIIYLLEYYTISGENVRYSEWKFDFMGKIPRHFEAFYISHENIKNIIGSNFQSIGFTRMDQEHLNKYVCLNLYTSRTLGANKYSYDSNFERRGVTHGKETNLEVLLDCNRNAFSINVIYKISEERSTEIMEYCKANYGEENCYVENYNLLSYDDVSVTFRDGDNNVTKNAQHFIQSLLQLYYGKGFEFEILRNNPKFNLRRNIVSGNWDVFVKSKSEDVYLSTFSNNIIFKILTESSTTLPFIELFLDFSERSLKPKCTIKKNFVETFDGVKFDYKLSNCWTLASQTVDSIQRNVLLVRKPQADSSVPDFKYIIFETGTVVELSNNELKVNGSVVYNIKNDPDFSFTVVSDFIFKRGITYLIYSKDTTGRPNIIISKDKIEYHKEEKYYSSNGICGNGDGETIPELIGPKNCVYNDGQTFTASWAGQSENCDSATLKDYRKGVDDYQTKCEPYYYQLKESPMNHRCLLFGWKTLEANENSYCISAQPLTFCSSDCDIKTVETVKITYKCWPKEKAPSTLRTSIENKDDIATDPISADPQFYQHLTTEMVKICKGI